MKHAIITVCICLITLTFVGSVHAEPAGRFSLETGVDTSSGKYGKTQSTDILYVPVTGKYQGQSWTFKLTVPYLQITGPGNVVNGVGQTAATTPSTPTTTSGLGDVVASASNLVYSNTATGNMVSLTGKVKFGTASSAKSLGSGMNDYSLQTDLYQVYGNFTSFESVGYRVYGSPSTYTLNNVTYGLLGGSFRFSKESSGGLMLNYGGRVIATGTDHKEAILFFSNKMSKDWKLQAYMLKGFTTSSPDWGAGLTSSFML